MPTKRIIEIRHTVPQDAGSASLDPIICRNHKATLKQVQGDGNMFLGLVVVKSSARARLETLQYHFI